MLNIPVRGDGSIDELERTSVEEIGVWMKANSKKVFMLHGLGKYLAKVHRRKVLQS